MQVKKHRCATVGYKAIFSLTALLAGGLGTAGWMTGAAAQNRPVFEAQGEFVPDVVLVSFKEDVPLAARLGAVARVGLAPDPSFKSNAIARLRITPQGKAAGVTVASAVATLKRDGTVRAAEPDHIYRLAAAPNDPRFSELYGLNNTGQGGGRAGAHIGALRAWDVVTGSDQVVVAVIDSGVDYDHPDLKDNIMKDSAGKVVGFDYVNNDADPQDDEGHGTHVAGTIGARGNNGVGVTGVIQRVKMIPLKAFDATGAGSASADIASIDFAIQNGAQIINASWGGPIANQLLLDAVNRAARADILIPSAAGNGGDDGIGDDNETLPHYPSSWNTVAPNVISVAATDNTDAFTGFSNFGAKSVDIAAPGGAILSTVPTSMATDPANPYDIKNGTSMATPHVSGAAALLLANNPNLSALDLKSRLFKSADRVQAFNGKITTGGRLNLSQALQQLTLTSPASGDVFLSGSDVSITWDSEGFTAPHFVKLEASTDGGTTFTTLADRTEDDGEFTTSTLPLSNNLRIRISGVGDTVTDSSDASFSVVDGSIQLVAPLGGEEFEVGKRVLLSWDSQGYAKDGSRRVKLEFSRDGGQTYEDIFASTTNDGQEAWTVTGPATTQGRIRVTTVGRLEFSDESPSNFQVREAYTLEVTRPAGGEIFREGQALDIAWTTSSSVTGNVAIDRSRDGGATWETLFPSTRNDGTERWIVTGPTTRLGRIRVRSLTRPEVSDTNNGVFQVQLPSLTVTGPRAGSRFLANRDSAVITWSSTGLGLDSRVNVEVSRDGGLSWETIAANTPNDGSAAWAVTGRAATNALVRVTSVADSSIQDISDVAFSVEEPTLFLVTPNGGETLRPGDETLIQWSGSSVGVGTVDIELSTDGGATWSVLFAGTSNDGSEAWTVDSAKVKSARIRVTWNDDAAIQDASDRSFAINGKASGGGGGGRPNQGRTPVRRKIQR